MNQVHLKCWNGALGCTKCCECIIPGFHTYSYELLDDPYIKNDKIFNPYDSNHFSQLIGDALGGVEEINTAFNDVSDLLINSKDKQPLKIDKSSDAELSIFSLKNPSAEDKPKYKT